MKIIINHNNFIATFWKITILVSAYWNSFENQKLREKSRIETIMKVYYILLWNPVIWLVNTKSLFFYNDRWKRILTRTSCLVFTFASVKYGVEYESSQVCEFQWGRFERNSKQLWGREYQKINKDSCKRFSGIFTF